LSDRFASALGAGSRHILTGRVLGRQVADYVLATDVGGHQPIPPD
jgi:hypothetical protein